MSDTRDQIITSPAADRMIGRVSPIYDDSVIGLSMFEAIGREYDALLDIINDLPNQLYPDTATWMLVLWERRYGLDGTGLTIEQRRRQIRMRRVSKGAFNPARVERLAYDITGFSARVEENVGPYTFAVYLTAVTAEESVLRAKLRKLKPSHLSFVIRYEQYVSGQLYMGGNIACFADFSLSQVN